MSAGPEGQDKINDSEKLTAILPYIRALDEETKRTLERLRQSNGGSDNLTKYGYGELLDKVFELHSRFEKEREEQCRPWLDKVQGIEEKIQSRRSEEIAKLIGKTLEPLRRN